MNTPLKFITLLFTLLANLATPAEAMSPQGRHIIGTIRNVDEQAREVEMLREDKGTVIKFVWNSRRISSPEDSSRHRRFSRRASASKSSTTSRFSAAPSSEG